MARSKEGSVVMQRMHALADHFPARYEATQMGSKINAVQKEIGQLRKVRGHVELV